MQKPPLVANAKCGEKLFAIRGIAAWSLFDMRGSQILLSFWRLGTAWPRVFALLAKNEIPVRLEHDSRGRIILIVSLLNEDANAASQRLMLTLSVGLSAESPSQRFFRNVGWVSISGQARNSSTRYRRRLELASHGSKMNFRTLLVKSQDGQSPKMLRISTAIVVTLLFGAIVASLLPRGWFFSAAHPRSGPAPASIANANSSPATNSPKTSSFQPETTKQPKPTRQKVTLVDIERLLSLATFGKQVSFDPDRALDGLVAAGLAYQVIQADNLGGWQSLTLKIEGFNGRIRANYQLFDDEWVFTDATAL